MLSEEEKKAIEDLKDFKSISILYGNTFIMFLGQLKKYQEATDTALNLITKLQKEIDRQKEKRENQKVELAILNEKQKEMNKLKNTVNSYYGMFKKQEKVIREIQKENEEKDKQIDLILKEQIEDGYLVNFNNLKEARKYYEELSREKGAEG